MIKRWGIVRAQGSFTLKGGPYTRLGAHLRVTNRRLETVVPWEGNGSDTIDAYMARSIMAAAPSHAVYPKEWDRWLT